MSGYIFANIHAIVGHLSRSAHFQSLAEVATPEALIADHIHLHYMTPKDPDEEGDYKPAELTSLRPYAWVGLDNQETLAMTRSDSHGFNYSGVVPVCFAMNVAPWINATQLLERLQAFDTDMSTIIDEVIADAQHGGVLIQACHFGTPRYPTTLADQDASGSFIALDFDFSWGTGEGGGGDG